MGGWERSRFFRNGRFFKPSLAHNIRYLSKFYFFLREKLGHENDAIFMKFLPLFLPLSNSLIPKGPIRTLIFCVWLFQIRLEQMSFFGILNFSICVRNSILSLLLQVCGAYMRLFSFMYVEIRKQHDYFSKFEWNICKGDRSIRYLLWKILINAILNFNYLKYFRLFLTLLENTEPQVKSVHFIAYKCFTNMVFPFFNRRPPEIASYIVLEKNKKVR